MEVLQYLRPSPYQCVELVVEQVVVVIVVVVLLSVL